jgi:hypothetical protein
MKNDLKFLIFSARFRLLSTHSYSSERAAGSRKRAQERKRSKFLPLFLDSSFLLPLLIFPLLMLLTT